MSKAEVGSAVSDSKGLCGEVRMELCQVGLVAGRWRWPWWDCGHMPALCRLPSACHAFSHHLQTAPSTEWPRALM